MLYPGLFPLRNIPTTLSGLQTRISAWLTILIMGLLASIRYLLSVMTKRFPHQDISFHHHRTEDPQGYVENGKLSFILRRLGELEAKVQALEAKPPQVPFDQEELLNAAVYRVDALEAELISVKKVHLHCWKKSSFEHRYRLENFTLHNIHFNEFICFKLFFKRH
jgi:hypothetical protein